jgi:hypothetical protein
LSLTLERISHFPVKSLFEVGFPGWVVGISGPFDFDVAFDGYGREVDELDGPGLSVFTLNFSAENPFPPASGGKVFLLYPFW